MKINIKFFKKEKSFKKKNFKLNASLYWKIFIGGTFLAILYIFYFGYNLFTQVNQEVVLPNPSGNIQSKIIDTSRIGKALNYFSVREENSNQIINSPAPVVDPSL